MGDKAFGCLKLTGLLCRRIPRPRFSLLGLEYLEIKLVVYPLTGLLPQLLYDQERDQEEAEVGFGETSLRYFHFLLGFPNVGVPSPQLFIDPRGY